MKAYKYIVVLVVCFLCFIEANAQPIAVLEDTVAVRKTRLDSLGFIQQGLANNVKRLASVIDSLKSHAQVKTARGDLEVALRQSVQVALQLEEVYDKQAKAERILEVGLVALQGGYDREIGVLISTLDAQSGPESITRLKLFQQRRKALSDLLVGRELQGKLPLVIIRPEDSPDAVRQKADLMQDVARQLQRELEATNTRLQKLVDEKRLRSQAEGLMNEISLFDEGAPVGRSLKFDTQISATAKENELPLPTGGQDGVQAPGLSGLVPSAPASDVERGTELFEPLPVEPIDRVLETGIEVHLNEFGTPRDALLGGGAEGEIREIEQQKFQLEKQVEQATARAEALQRFLKQMLGGTQ